MKTETTYQATIFLGLKEGYEGVEHSIDEVVGYCQEYCTQVGLCVTVTQTTYCYENGNENGAIIGLINYPRFPSTPEKICTQAIDLAEHLQIKFKQNRVSLIAGNKTMLIEPQDEVKS